MKDKQKEFLKILGANKDITETALEAFLTGDEDIFAIYDYYEQKHSENPRDIYYDSISYIATNKRFFIFESKQSNYILKILNLRDIYKIEINREKIFPNETDNVKASDTLKEIAICFKDKDSDIKIDFKDNPMYGILIQKSKAMNFIISLNKIIY